MASQAARHAAMRDMFLHVERRWGGLDRLVKPLPVERGPLTSAALRRLFRHESLALVVPGFVEDPAPLADALVAAAATARNWSVSSARGLESSDVQAVGGTPYNVAVGGGDAERHFAE